MLRFFTVVAVIIALSITLNVAQAQTVDAAGAEKVRLAFEDATAFYVSSYEKTGSGMSIGGPVEVTPKGSYYEVKVPGVVLTNDNTRMQLGTVMLNVTPEADGDYRTTIAIPQNISLKDDKDQDRMTLTLGQQKFSGIWNPALGLFTQAQGDYRDVTATVLPTPDNDKLKEPVTITIGQLKSEIAMQKDGTRWSGPQSTQINNVNFLFGPGKANRMTLESLKAHVDYKGLDLSLHKKLRDEMQNHLASQGQEMSPEALQQLVSSTLGGGKAMPESVESKLDMANLAIDIAAHPAVDDQPASEAVSLRLARGSSYSKALGLQTDTGSAGAQMNLVGLTVEGFDGPLRGMVPSDVSLNLQGDKVPFTSIFAAMTTAMERALEAQGTAETADEARQQATLYVQQALTTIPKLLATAGTTLTINDSFTKATDLSTTMNGQLTATEGSPFIFAGTITLTMNGMDELIAKLQEEARTNGNSKAAGYAQMLILMQLSGQLDKGPDGKSRRTYAVGLTPTGGVSLNGVDMQGMLPGMPVAPAPRVEVPDTTSP